MLDNVGELVPHHNLSPLLVAADNLLNVVNIDNTRATTGSWHQPGVFANPGTLGDGKMVGEIISRVSGIRVPL